MWGGRPDRTYSKLESLTKDFDYKFQGVPSIQEKHVETYRLKVIKSISCLQSVVVVALVRLVDAAVSLIHCQSKS